MALSATAFWILTVLAAGRRHGYQIMREVDTASEGTVVLKATTLYSSLDRLERDGLIVTDGEEIVDGRARRYYVITEAGQGRLAIEADLLTKAAKAARTGLAGARPSPQPAGWGHGDE